MKLPKELTTVTTLSKYVALSLFIFLPIFAFTLGMRYQKAISNQNPVKPPILNIDPTEEPVACTMEAKECPDGSFVGRSGPKCAFDPCPGEDGLFCGGIAGKECPEGYYCKYDGTYPDAGGTCMR